MTISPFDGVNTFTFNIVVTGFMSDIFLFVFFLVVVYKLEQNVPGCEHGLEWNKNRNSFPGSQLLLERYGHWDNKQIDQ